MDAHQVDFLDLLNGQIQYVVPRWQRRYCWGQSDIERLVYDLLTVSKAKSDTSHYGGTLLTFPEPGAAGVVKTIRVVDGQQRLTTVSILLACIADELGPDGGYGDWTAQVIRDDRLTNAGKTPEKYRKLRLQNGDEEEYRSGLEGNPTGTGAVAQAWKIVRRLVTRKRVGSLLEGLQRLRVISIGLVDGEDPQQIFESLNATGRPLTESEKVKNWLLMGLPDAEQQQLHDTYWRRIETSLGAEHTTEPVDMFLRDFLRWRTGHIQGANRAYEGIRRWAMQTGNQRDRPALCRDFARLAQFYGALTGTGEPHPDRKVEQELRHLREMGSDIHRPLTLRLLDDADNGRAGATDDALAKTFAALGTWITRLWLADCRLAGMNTAVAELAHGPGPGEGEDFAEHWFGRIRSLRNTRVGVPDDEAVREGIRTRKAYGGSATRSSRAILCAMMEAEHREEAPARGHLTIEHVMPQKLTDDWKRALGNDADEIHGRYRDRLPNLTLSGDVTNAAMGTDTFDKKREVYRRSAIGLTRRLADEDDWGPAAFERRAEDLARRAIGLWSWSAPEITERKPQNGRSQLRWRIDGGDWNDERAASQMVLNVAGALLDRDPGNARKLSGPAIASNVHLASSHPEGSAGSLNLRAVPGREAYVLYPYERGYPHSAERCRKMGERCNVRIDVEFSEGSVTATQEFWKFPQDCTGGLPGQKDTWRGAGQRTRPANASGDCIGIHVGEDECWLCIRSGQNKHSSARTARMQRLSGTIIDRMGDQELGGNPDRESVEGRTIKAVRRWNLYDEGEWPDAAWWIRDQQERLEAILASLSGQDETAA